MREFYGQHVHFESTVQEPDLSTNVLGRPEESTASGLEPASRKELISVLEFERSVHKW